MALRSVTVYGRSLALGVGIDVDAPEGLQSLTSSHPAEARVRRRRGAVATVRHPIDGFQQSNAKNREDAMDDRYIRT